MAYIGAYWGSRPQTLSECASSLALFLLSLKEYNGDIFGNWFEQGMSKKSALSKPVEVDEEVIARLLSKKNKGSDLPEISYRLSLWNGAQNDDFGIVLRVALGSSDTRFCLNSCLLEFGENDVYNALIFNSSSMSDLKGIVNKSWSPDNVKFAQ